MTSASQSSQSTADDAQLPTLELTCFGPPDARVGGRAAPADVLWRKNFALLVYLALAPDHTRSRDHLIGLLWSEKDETHARRSLNEATRRLRISLGAGRIETTGAAVSLNPHGLKVDALDVESAQGPEAISLLRGGGGGGGGGDFLEGWVIEHARAFEEWVASQRVRFGELAQRLFLDAAESALEGLDLSLARDMARRALDAEPYSERAARLLMLSQAQQGDSTRALATFSQFAARLATDLDERPGPELAKLRERIEAGNVAAGAAPAVAASAQPLVGRAAVHHTVFGQLVQGMRAGPRAVVITGDPGFGRTRLLDECVRRTALEGAVTAVASPLESDHDSPYSTLAMLLRDDLARAPGVLGTDSESLGVLSAIEPLFLPSSQTVEPRDTVHVAGALRACFEAITDEQPLVLAIDDAHYADGLTLVVLRAAMRQLDTAPLVMILTAPSDTDAVPRELLALRSALGRDMRGAVVELQPLQVEDVAELARTHAPWCEGATQRNRLARRLTFETEGSPLFIVTLLRALQEESELRKDLLVWPIPKVTLSGPLPIQIPDVVRSAVAMRIASLDDTTAQVLKVVSILGQAVQPDLVAATLGMSHTDVNRSIVALEKAGFVAYRGSRPAVAAPLIAQAIQKLYLTSGERQRLRQQVVAALEELPGPSAQVDRARVLADAGRTTEAFDLAIAAANEALDGRAPRTARRSIEVAMRVSGAGDVIEIKELEERLAMEEGEGEGEEGG